MGSDTNYMFGNLSSTLLNRPTPIIVGGFYRSGTSLVRRILDSHSGIHCPSEMKFFKDFYGDYPDDPFAHVRFFSTVKSMGLSESEILNESVRLFIKFHELAARKNGKRRWADKNPDNLLYLDHWMRALKEMQFIFVVRNPLDVMASLLEVKFEKTIPEVFEEKIEIYSQFLLRGINFLERNRDIIFILKYEDLVCNTDDELQRLFNFLGEKFELKVKTDFSSSKRGSGIEDPKIGNRKDIHTDSINRWKRELTSEQVDLIIKRIVPLMKGMGCSWW